MAIAMSFTAVVTESRQSDIIVLTTYHVFIKGQCNDGFFRQITYVLQATFDH